MKKTLLSRHDADDDGSLPDLPWDIRGSACVNNFAMIILHSRGAETGQVANMYATTATNRHYEASALM